MNLIVSLVLLIIFIIHLSMKKLVPALFAVLSVFATSAIADDNNKRQRPERANFQSMDKDGNGVLTQSEVQGPLKQNFAKVDTNGDGKITQDELRNYKPESRQARSDDDDKKRPKKKDGSNS